MSSLVRFGKRLLLYLAVSASVVFSIGPIIWMFLSSVRPKTEFFTIPSTFFPKDWTFINFELLFNDTSFVSWLLNSLYITIGVIIFTTVIAVLGAYSLTRFNYRGREVFAVFSLFAHMLPTVLLVIPLYLFMAKINLINKLGGLTLTYIALCLPYCLWTLRAFFVSLPYELEEAAFIDGASRMQSLFYVITPLLLPGIISTAVYSFSVIWNEYLFALVFISSDAKMTFPVGISSFVTPYDVFWEYILTGSVIISIPAVIIFLLTQRALIKGWGAGSIKG